MTAAAQGYATFDTAIGPCGIAWGPNGVVGVQLPEPDGVDGLRSQLNRRFGLAAEAEPSADATAAIEIIVALLRGEDVDLTGIALDMTAVTPFRREVYRAAREIPVGATSSYGELAQRIGSPGAARAIGQAMGNNPFPIVVPCHRVLAAGGKIGGFSADGGTDTKVRMLAIEGAVLDTVDPTPRMETVSTPSSFPFDPAAAIDHLQKSDPILGDLIADVGPFTMQLTGTPSVFAALAQAIVYQQLNGRAAETIFGRVKALFPAGELTPEAILGASDDDLRGAGLSRAKLLALRDLALKVVDGDLPTLAEAHDLDDSAIVERLTAVRGIGPWTAEMFLMFTLGRPDVLPLDDFGIRKGAASLFGLPEPPDRNQLRELGAAWSPYRTVASWYLWRAAEVTTPGPE